ncbi:kelch repeat-containing protein [Streptomyces sp. SAJ15]|uniref:kelch repeat-containing protein n=1 Tax=Streptomyces sp. SAJ15 TaxID=2011095 RepID=UPI001185BD16|nr:kelch repeat-containing protein [Streptomyces sp. SAJ15]TVL90241.1 hypothetical protein CD790_22230 [Streptomyces sp. SAJ15]
MARPRARRGHSGGVQPRNEHLADPDVEGLRGACVYAIGGFNPTDEILDTVEAYSPATNTWRAVASMGTTRVALAAASAPCPKGDRGLKSTCAYAIAGFTTFTDFATNTAEVFSPGTNTWSSLPDLATARFEPAAATAPCPKNVRGPQRTCVYAIGGIGDSPFPTLSSVEALPVGG